MAVNEVVVGGNRCGKWKKILFACGEALGKWKLMVVVRKHTHTSPLSLILIPEI